MKLSKPKDKKALEEVVKDNFCGKQSIIGCPYNNKIWCLKNCGFYIKQIEGAKYWNR